MAYKVVIEDPHIWKKDCRAIPHDRLLHILRKIRGLAEDPWAPNIQVQQLKEYPLADFRLRIGDYRVLFDKDEETKTIMLFRVLHRSKSYR